METISNLRDETIEAVQDLIEINIDSARGFETAAGVIRNKTIADWFRRCSAERAGFAEELRRFIRMNGEAPERTGSVKGAAHRAWLGARGELQQGDDHAVLEEAERGEDAIKERYEKVIREYAASPLAAVLHRHYAAVKQVHDRVRELRDAARGAKE